MPIEMVAKNSDIAAIGAEGNVERITDEWNGAHDAFEGNIREHAREDMLRHTERRQRLAPPDSGAAANSRHRCAS